MADPIQTQILDALVSIMQSIRVSNGYRTDVEHVEVAARDWGECVESLPYPWLGIVPYEAPVTEYPSRLEYEWRMNIISHQVSTAKDADGLIAKVHPIQEDIRNAIYEDPTLGVDGVIYARVTETESTEAHPQAAIEGLASTRTGISVLYEEDLQ